MLEGCKSACGELSEGINKSKTIGGENAFDRAQKVGAHSGARLKSIWRFGRAMNQQVATQLNKTSRPQETIKIR
jgi:hypothetical protein